MQCVSSPITHQSKSWQCRTKGVSKWDLYCMQMFILILSWSVSVYFVLFSLMSFPPQYWFYLIYMERTYTGLQAELKKRGRKIRKSWATWQQKSNPTTLRKALLCNPLHRALLPNDFISLIFLPWLSRWQMIDDCSSVENPIYWVKVEGLRPPEKGSSFAVIIENIPWKNVHFFFWNWKSKITLKLWIMICRWRRGVKNTVQLVTEMTAPASAQPICHCLFSLNPLRASPGGWGAGGFLFTPISNFK